LILLQGDENGEIVVYDISVILEQVPDLVATDITTKANTKRNPHREFPIERDETKKKNLGGAAAAMDSDSDLDESTYPDDKSMLVQEAQINTILKKSRKHQDLIKSIQYISITDRPLIMTGSNDRLVHLIDMETSAIVGTLKQGYKTMLNYIWDFPIDNFLREHPERMTRMESILTVVREERDQILGPKKNKEIELLKAGKLEGLGFTGSQVTGLGNQGGTYGAPTQTESPMQQSRRSEAYGGSYNET